MSRHMYLCLGDSIACGQGPMRQDSSYAHWISDALRTSGICDEAILFAKANWTAHHLWAAVQQLPHEIWQETAVATLLIGGNDLRRTYYPALAAPQPMRVIGRAVQQFDRTFRRLCEFLAQQSIPTVIVQTLYNPIPQAVAAEMAIDGVNRIMMDAASEHGFRTVNLKALFASMERSWIDGYRSGQWHDLCTPFSRPIHPNQEGHRAIAKATLEVLEAYRTASIPNHSCRASDVDDSPCPLGTNK